MGLYDLRIHWRANLWNYGELSWISTKRWQRKAAKERWREKARATEDSDYLASSYKIKCFLNVTYPHGLGRITVRVLGNPKQILSLVKQPSGGEATCSRSQWEKTWPW